jgi:hypothetical protein
MDAGLTYQQILAQQYEDSARNILAFEETEYESVRPQDMYMVSEHNYDVEHGVDVADPDAYKQFAGNRNDEEDVVKAQPFEDKSKLSVRYSKDVKLNVFNVDSRFRAYVTPGAGVDPGITSGTGTNSGISAYLASLSPNAVSNASHFVFRFQRQVRNAISIKLSSLELPNVFANFSSARGNTKFRVRIGGNSGDITHKIVDIAPDNVDGTANPQYYPTPNLLVAAVNTSLTGFGSPYTSITCGLNSDGYITFQNNSGTTFEFDFVSSPLISPELFVPDGTQELDTTYRYSQPQVFDVLGLSLGFGKQQTTTLNAASTLTAKFLPDLNSDDYIYMSINDYNTVVPQTVNNTYFTVFAKIPIAVEKGRMILDSDVINTTNKTYRFLQPTNIQQLEIELLDRAGNELTFDNDYSMTLEIEEVISQALYEKLREL